jgi:pantetheine-phosphate adenylyltransferase
MKRWLYPGSFDPPTKGHLDLIQRAIPLCDELIVAVANNPEKSTFFTSAERLELTRAMTEGMPGISLINFDTLLTEQFEQHEVSAVLRGVRAFSDFEYEFVMALTNRKLLDSFDTVFMMPSESCIYLSSSLVREIMSYGGDIGEFVTARVLKLLQDWGKA